MTAASLQDKLLRLKQKVASERLVEESLQQGLTAQIQQVKQKTQDLQAQLSRTQQQTETRLRNVSVCSSRAAKELQAAVAKVRRPPACLPLSCLSPVGALPQGHKLLLLAKLCHQLEVRSGVTCFRLEEAEAPPTVRLLFSLIAQAPALIATVTAAR